MAAFISPLSPFLHELHTFKGKSGSDIKGLELPVTSDHKLFPPLTCTCPMFPLDDRNPNTSMLTAD